MVAGVKTAEPLTGPGAVLRPVETSGLHMEPHMEPWGADVNRVQRALLKMAFFFFFFDIGFLIDPFRFIIKCQYILGLL